MDVRKLNEKQAEAFQQFRELVKDCKLHDNSDSYLLRWLIARNFDVKKAEDMLRASLEWRKKYKVNSLRDYTSPEVMEKYCSAGRVGVDKSNYPRKYTINQVNG